MVTDPAWRALYPFESHTFDNEGLQYHYLDEGQGAPVIMVHGNPTWSFYYRNLVLALRDTHRCLVPDHIGCGLSEKPGDADYDFHFGRRVDDLDRWITHLNLGDDLTLVAHDWGGMIAMTWASRNAARVKRLVLMNTAAFPLPASKPLPRSLWLARDTWVGSMLVKRFNAFVRGMLRYAVMGKVAPDVRAGYLAPYDTPANRIATLRFVQDIPLKPADPGWDTLQAVADAVPGFASIPTLIGWGHKDFVFDRHFLDVWKTLLPDAEYVEYPEAGHLLLEDEGPDFIARIQAFFTTHPVA